jgi:hypothetical protein
MHWSWFQFLGPFPGVSGCVLAVGVIIADTSSQEPWYVFFDSGVAILDWYDFFGVI